MFGPDEHRNALRRIKDVQREVEHLRGLVTGLRLDLYDDDLSATQATRDSLRVVSTQLDSARLRLDVAASVLPEPSKYARLTGEL